jgi:VanZ family protein
MLLGRKTASDMRPNLLCFSCLFLWLGLMVAGLWPFNFRPRNRVDWLSAPDGLHFNQYGQIYSQSPLRLKPAPAIEAGSQGFTVELGVTPPTNYDTISTILCVCDPAQKRDLTLQQWGAFLMVHGYFRDVTSGGTLASLWMGHVGSIERPAWLTITSGPEGTMVYVDGRPRTSLRDKTILPETDSGFLLLGHSPSGGAAWSGDIFGLAFYNRPLAPNEVAAHHQIWRSGKTEQLNSAFALYTFDEGKGSFVHNRIASPAPDLLIPARFEPFRPKILDFPQPIKKSDVQDTIVNILGFIPFGFLLMLYLHHAEGYPKADAVFLSVTAGATTSLIIELAQVLLPTRDSSALDLINNVVGTLAGSLLALAMHDCWYRSVNILLRFRRRTRENR